MVKNIGTVDAWRPLENLTISSWLCHDAANKDVYYQQD
jgi:hypothetical protein